MKITKLKYAIVLLLMAFTLHKFYVSITEIKQNKANNTLEISMRLFVNDMDDALKAQFGKSFDLGTKGELEDTDEKLKLYFLNHFKLKINGKWVAAKFIGKDFDGYDIVYCYFEVEKVKKIKSIDIKNTTLMELFPEQENIIQLDINDSKKSMKLNKREQENKIIYTK